MLTSTLLAAWAHSRTCTRARWCARTHTDNLPRLVRVCWVPANGAVGLGGQPRVDAFRVELVQAGQPSQLVAGLVLAQTHAAPARAHACVRMCDRTIRHGPTHPGDTHMHATGTRLKCEKQVKGGNATTHTRSPTHPRPQGCPERAHRAAPVPHQSTQARKHAQWHPKHVHVRVVRRSRRAAGRPATAAASHTRSASAGHAAASVAGRRRARGVRVRGQRVDGCSGGALVLRRPAEPPIHGHAQP